MQKMLFSSQSAALGNAFDVSYATIQAVRKDGADLYVNKVNSDKGYYDLGCARKEPSRIWRCVKRGLHSPVSGKGLVIGRIHTE